VAIFIAIGVNFTSRKQADNLPVVLFVLSMTMLLLLLLLLVVVAVLTHNLFSLKTYSRKFNAQ